MSDETIELNWRNLWPVVTGNETTVHKPQRNFNLTASHLNFNFV